MSVSKTDLGRDLTMCSRRVGWKVGRGGALEELAWKKWRSWACTVAQPCSLAIHKTDSSRNLRREQLAGSGREAVVSLERTGRSTEACRLTVCHLQSEDDRQGSMAMCSK